MEKIELRPFSVLERETRTFDVSVLAELFLKKINKVEDEEYIYAGIDNKVGENGEYCFREFIIKYAEIKNMPVFNSVKEVNDYLDNKEAIVLSGFDINFSQTMSEKEIEKLWEENYKRSITIELCDYRFTNPMFKNHKYLLNVLRTATFKRRENLLDDTYYEIIDEKDYNGIDYQYISTAPNNKILVINMNKFDEVRKKIKNSQYNLETDNLSLER